MRHKFQGEIYIMLQDTFDQINIYQHYLKQKEALTVLEEQEAGRLLRRVFRYIQKIYDDLGIVLQWECILPRLVLYKNKLAIRSIYRDHWFEVYNKAENTKRKFIYEMTKKVVSPEKLRPFDLWARATKAYLNFIYKHSKITSLQSIYSVYEVSLDMLYHTQKALCLVNGVLCYKLYNGGYSIVDEHNTYILKEARICDKYVCYQLMKGIVLDEIYEDFSYKAYKDEYKAFCKENLFYLRYNDFMCLLNPKESDEVSLYRFKKNPNFHTFQKIINIENLNLLDYLPDKLADILYWLCNGSYETLNQFAKLVTCMLAEQSLMKKIFVIYAPKNVHDLLLELFQMLGEYKIKNMSFQYAVRPKGLYDTIEANLNGAYANITVDTPLPKNKRAEACLEDIVTAKIIRAKHTICTTVKGVNHMPFVYITDDDKKYNYFIRSFQAVGILLRPDSEMPYEHLGDLPKEDVEWLKRAFALYGLYLIAFRTKPKVSAKTTLKNSANGIDSFGDFVDKCCTLTDETSYCIKTELYQAYRQFYQKYFGGKLLTEREFVIAFKKWGNFKDSIIHKSDENRLRVFEGISLDNRKFDNVMKQVKAVSESTDVSRTQFYEYLKNMCLLIPNNRDTRMIHERF